VRKAKKTYQLDDDALYSLALAKAKRDSCRLRYDLERLGMLTKDDRLWALLAEKEEEIDAKLFAEISQLGKGSAKRGARAK
jgi:hypothetical protein